MEDTKGINGKSTLVEQSFDKMDSLFANVNELREISNFLQNNISVYDKSVEKSKRIRIFFFIANRFSILFYYFYFR